MSPPSKASLRASTMRRSIASLAARLMAEDGIADYGLAKRKAARQLGAPESEALPNNAEIEVELRAYQSLYQGEEQRQRLRELRTAALAAMQLLQDFRPYLTGAVLDGTAGRYASVEIEAFPESAKDVEIFLLNRNIPYTHAEPRRSGYETPDAILLFDYAGAAFSLAIFDPAVERSQRRNGRTVERARAEAVAALLQEKTP